VAQVEYGTRTIEYSHIVDSTLKNAYITVDFYEGVILKSPPVDENKAKELIHKKGRWIFEKLKLVERLPQGDIVTGSRMLYLGKRYYVKLIQDTAVKDACATFNQSKFKIYVNPNVSKKLSINTALERFSRDKAVIKIKPRIKKWSKITGLTPSDIKFRKLNKRWGSCTKNNEIIINFDVVKLPFTLIDYIVVHELTHIKHKNHSKDFYKEVAKYIPAWSELDERLGSMKL